MILAFLAVVGDCNTKLIGALEASGLIIGHIFCIELCSDVSMPTERSWFATATTSAPEAEPEAKLHEALPDFIKDRTVLISAHRLSAVKQADHVYVLDNG